MTTDRRPDPDPAPQSDLSSDTDLDSLFAQARGAAAPLPADLSARLVAQAEAMLPPATGPKPGSARGQRGWLSGLRGLLADLGGGPGLAGLSVAGVAGLWIGFVQPEAVAGVPGLLWEGAASVSPTLAGLRDEATPFDDFDPDP
jgi:hypothetical protein